MTLPVPTAFVLTHESDPQRQDKSISIIALAIVRSLGRHGVPVVRIHPNLLDHGLQSRYCRAIEISPDFYQSEDDLVAFLLQMKERYPGKGILIPASDDCAYFVSKHRDALSAAFSVMAPPWSVMRVLIDKRSQYAAAEQLGIPIPETYFPTGVDDLVRLAPTLENYPYIIKPLVAHQWRRAAMKAIAQGRKAVVANTSHELISRYAEIAQGDTNVMVQEVIGGSDERLFTFLAYFDVQSQPQGYCIRKKIRQLPVDFGYCTLTESCFDPVVEAQSIRLLQGVAYHGMCGVEWKLDPKSARYKLVEINARAVNTVALAAACGVDLPYIAFANTAGLPQPPPVATLVPWRQGIKWINVVQDVWASRSLHQMGRLSLAAWWLSIRGPKVDAVFANDDWRPFTGYFLGFLKTIRFGGWLRRRWSQVPIKNSLLAK